MATAVAQKIEFPAVQHDPVTQDNNAPVQAATRAQALDAMVAGRNAVHEQGVDAQIYRAASGLIQRDSAGHPVNIEAYGYPYDVLENVAAQLESMGASQYVTAQVMGALKDYIINMGSDFSRAANAKPLYVRIMVTDQEPDDLPECEQTQAVFLDGMRKIGGEAARIMVQNTVFGTKSTTSQGVDLNAMFASKTKGLFVFFGSPTNEGIGGFDSVDAALVNLAQGMGGGVGGAGGATQQAVEEIKQAIKNGEATPQTLKLIENIAAMAQLADAIKTPGAVANAPAQMADIVRTITQQIQTGVAEGTVPAAVLQGTAAVIANMQGNEIVQAVLASPDGAKSLLVTDNGNDAAAPKADVKADNDNKAVPNASVADNDNAAITVQVQEISAQLTEMAADPATPPDVRAQIETQIADMAKAVESPQGADMQTALASVSQTLAAIDAPAADVIAAKVDVAAVQIETAQPQAQAQAQMQTSPAMDVAAVALAADAAAPVNDTAIAALPAAEIKELVAVLQKADALPPALAEAVQKIDIQTMAPEKIADAVQGKGESAPAVQAVIATLADPAVRAQLPAETVSSVNNIVVRAPDLVVPAAVAAAPITSVAAPSLATTAAPPVSTPAPTTSATPAVPPVVTGATPSSSTATPVTVEKAPTPVPPPVNIGPNPQPPNPQQGEPPKIVDVKPPSNPLPPQPGNPPPPTNPQPGEPPNPKQPNPQPGPKDNILPPKEPGPAPVNPNPNPQPGPEGKQPEPRREENPPRNPEDTPRPSDDPYKDPTDNRNPYGDPTVYVPPQPIDLNPGGGGEVPIVIGGPALPTGGPHINSPDDPITFTKPTGCGGGCKVCNGCKVAYDKTQAAADNQKATSEYAEYKAGRQRATAPSNQVS